MSIDDRIAQWTTSLDHSTIPVSTRRAATRSLYNYLGCALSGSHHPTVSRAERALKPFFGPATSTVFGTAVQTDAQHAALLNGIASHIHDYDDTHLQTIVHPTGCVASALLAYAQHTTTPVSGQTLTTALIAGIEVECKLALAVFPRHYDIGWHITSTTGAIGAAVAVSKLMNLPPTQVAHAIGIAATQVTGLRCNFGSDTKPFHVGRAAQNGLLAALLAQQDFTSTETSLEARRGWANVVTGGTPWNDELSLGAQLSKFIDELGHQWEIERNSFKPFPCGIVAHPAIDAAIHMRATIAKDVSSEPDVRRRLAELTFKARVHPLCIELTGNRTPRDGLQAKFSVFHGVAVGLVYGRAGPAEYADEVVTRNEVVAIRDAVDVAADRVVRSDEVVLVAFEKNKNEDKNDNENNDSPSHSSSASGLLPAYSVHIDHAIGSLDVPMTDAQLTDKFVGQVSTVADIGVEQAHALSDLCWRITDASDVASVLRRLGLEDTTPS